LKKGFSQLELLIFSLIVALLLAFGGGILKSYQTAAYIDSFSRRLESDLSYFRSLAMSDNIDLEILFYQDYYQVRSYEKVIKKQEYPEKFTIDYVRVGFKSSGTAKYAGSIVIKYRDRAKQKITIAPASGLIKRARI